MNILIAHVRCTYCIYIAQHRQEACATVEVESNKEMTGLNRLNGATARLVDISTIINHLGPMDPGGQKTMHQLSSNHFGGK